MTNRPPSVVPLTDSPLQQYYFRALICFAAAGTLASYMEWSELSALSPLYLGAMAFLLLYTYFTYHFTHKLPPERLKIVSRWLSYTDAALIGDRKSTRLNSSHVAISYAVFCLKKKTKDINTQI